MKIKLIIPYFGKLPGYFEFFLKSCEINTEIEYLIFTDQEKLPKCPPNVVVLHLTFAEFKQLAQKKLSLNERSMKALAPYKLAIISRPMAYCLKITSKMQIFGAFAMSTLFLEKFSICCHWRKCLIANVY